MLTPTQVIPFLLHNDEFVRLHAAEYLAKAHDPSPATAEHFWESIERFGADASLRIFDYLPQVPGTEKSTRQLLKALGAATSDETWLALVDAVAALSFPLLEQFQAEILALTDLLPPVTLRHLESRLRLAAVSPELLWTQLCDHANAANQYFEGELDPEKTQCLVEALARHPGYANLQAFKALEDEEAEESWLEIYCVDLLGATRCKEAVDLLIELLRRTDNDCILENVTLAFARIGDPSVIKKITAEFSEESYWFRLYANEIFSRIKHPDSETALLGLIEKEPELDIRTFLASSLCELCPERPDAIELLRRLILNKRYDRTVCDLKAQLVTVGVMIGQEIPEAKLWQPDIARQRKADLEFADSLLADKAPDFRARMMRGEDPYPDAAEDEFEENGTPMFEREPVSPEPQTPASAAPKIGRNYPCPCGSGKKYKKCCGAS